MAGLASFGALELLAGYRERVFSPVDVVEELAERIERSAPVLNAFITTTLERARAQAVRAEQAWMGGEARPLEGVPFGVKDLFDTAGVRTTYGSPMFDEFVPRADAAAVASTTAAGAILIGKTSTDEFAYGIAGVNPFYGPARNPWSTDRVSGGSSSGSAVALAAQLVPLALGSDTGGSIRAPAAFCGVVGFKGTWGAIPTDGMWAMGRTLDHAGPMARAPADIALWLRTLVGDARRSPIGTLEDSLLPAPAGTRLGVCPELDPLTPATDVRRAFDASIEALEACGFTVANAPFPDAPSLRTTFTTIRDAETLHTHRAAGLFPDRKSEYSDQTFQRLAAADEVELSAYLEASAERERLAEGFDRLFDDVDVLLAPVHSISPPLVDVERPDDVAWEGVGVYTTPEDLLGVPTCAIRAGFDDLGLPVGVQLIGRRGADATVLSVAQAMYEATTGVQSRWPELSEA